MEHSAKKNLLSFIIHAFFTARALPLYVDEKGDKCLPGTPGLYFTSFSLDASTI